ncbi:MAG: thioesterase family protein [Candidatus Pseudobacter hemicellulosilyticus]|uniref:Thioesterase family protein n=1 Tax=Candidatus Pseudobacter hemicellulosilyticus TaxID=3121375 RepID=A0AAJ6BHV0_9BACT|nr:MAG: thioesterase family protein [Pseudobacter sp.]
MTEYRKAIDVRWSDLDPNFHVRHSVYYDHGAYCRICFLEENGLNAALMSELRFGPILFREECVFRKEIRLGDTLHINLQLVRAKRDQSRWSIRHQLFKNGTVLAAVLNVDGAWINTDLRKLASPPEKVLQVFSGMPRSEDFEWIN